MTIPDNLELIRKGIRGACARVNRDPAEVRILGACKEQPLERIRAAVQAGVDLLGENRFQEVESHQPALADLEVEWHFIGKLQKNKINRILNRFHMVETVDGVKTMEHIHKRVDETRDVFIELNLGDEATKSGFTEAGLFKALNYMAQLNRVRVVGLMCVPPLSEDPEESRPWFRRLFHLREELNARAIANFHVLHLSMGMSNDYEVAVEEGATIVRIGSALFGRRAL
ncbi:MAG: YggS family pyridoxal phosphate-dependent enzyme [Acidobacteriota bacterium]|jgi:pyridoxal phosphate enzyme (YggS family)|nr:YggS family pyridoxal phosphate-dependent enzyme [Acidobacteriota bacterium]